MKERQRGKTKGFHLYQWWEKDKVTELSLGIYGGNIGFPPLPQNFSIDFFILLIKVASIKQNKENLKCIPNNIVLTMLFSGLEEKQINESDPWKNHTMKHKQNDKWKISVKVYNINQINSCRNVQEEKLDILSD